MPRALLSGFALSVLTHSSNSYLQTSGDNCRRALAGLFVRRERWSLSWWGRLLILAVLGGGLVGVGRHAHQFLALSKPVTADILVIEGWIPDYALDEAVLELQKGVYRAIVTCGGISKDGWNVVPKYTYADWAAARLRHRGLTNAVIAVPCRVERADRTYHSALAVRRWCETNGMPVVAINVVTVGPHARRSRLIFEKAFANRLKVGVLALEDRDYDPKRWWASSDGARQVVGELIAYLYACCFFFPQDSP